MIFSYNWLKEFTGLDIGPEALSDRLTMSGVEVEGIHPAYDKLCNVYPANIITIEKHPDADKLSVCRVETTGGEFSIVCGAKNMKVGDKVVLSRPGAILKGGFKIKKSKIRGVVSEGMLCSESELGLADESAGIMILPEETSLDADINDILELDDFKIDIGITPNRPDQYSVLGMAREIAAITGRSFTEPEVSLSEEGASATERIKVTNNAPQFCKRYMARVVEGVTVTDSPDWVKKRLEVHGIRPINNVVDATNYVLLERGQPLHAFDYKRISGGEIIVRTAEKDEKIETLDGKVRVLDEGTLLICDAKGPQALAGIMGGAGSEVTTGTTDIVLEAAWFEPTVIRRTSRKIGLSTDSSFMFERGIDIEGVESALDRAASLIKEFSGGTVLAGAVDVRSKEKPSREVSFRPEQAEKLLGIPVTAASATEVFKRLGLTVTSSTDGLLTITAPSFRDDIVAEVDLIEEIARLGGFDNIPTTLPVAGFRLGTDGEMHRLKRKIKKALISSGFYEVINYSFVSRESFEVTRLDTTQAVTITNPLSEEAVVMRPSLIPSLLDNLMKNLSRKNENLRIFEVSPVFILADAIPSESWKVSGLLYGRRTENSWNQTDDDIDFYDLKGTVEMLLSSLGITPDNIEIKSSDVNYLNAGKCASITLGGVDAGFFGEISQQISTKLGTKGPIHVFELDLSAITGVYYEETSYNSINRYPESARDIAFVIGKTVPFGEILKSISRFPTKVVEKVELFDVYCDESFAPGTHSLALRVTYRAKDRTLKNSEVDKVHSRIIKLLEQDFNAEIRGH